MLDALLEEPFVPNDTHLGGPGHPTAQICTGPNMGGKSSYIRQVALICIMAQVSSLRSCCSSERTPIGEMAKEDP